MKPEIIIDELTVLTSRSGGKGGQHVNKTESKVELIWDLNASRGVTDEEKNLLNSSLASKLKDGKLHVVSQISRSQIQNREEACRKMIDTIAKGLIRRKKRKPTKPSKAVKEKRMKDKKQRKEIKESRRKNY